jgi:hypothetical protein
MSEEKDLTQYIFSDAGSKYTLDENGNYHSYNGLPSYITIVGTEMYHFHGKVHNITGPAIKYHTGQKEYYIDDVLYSFKEDWEKQVNIFNLLKKFCENAIDDIEECPARHEIGSLIAQTKHILKSQNVTVDEEPNIDSCKVRRSKE